ncbi:hypothetical protein QQF64_006398 [Cirrhinus molitorella]|uniref:Uncharacterized protein n=1 Tax=Cirrhinus molitorella TaxID=172907 RepID=A0ABR3MEX7_9TELE
MCGGHADLQLFSSSQEHNGGQEGVKITARVMGSGLRALQDTAADVPGRCSHTRQDNEEISLCALTRSRGR